jgi:hypothetical protein
LSPCTVSSGQIDDQSSWRGSYLYHKDLTPQRRIDQLKDDFVNIVALHLKYIHASGTGVERVIAQSVRELFQKKYPDSPFKNYSLEQVARVSQSLDEAKIQSEVSTGDLAELLKGDLAELLKSPPTVSTTVASDTKTPPKLISLTEKAASKAAQGNPHLKERIAALQGQAKEMYNAGKKVDATQKKSLPGDNDFYRATVKDSTDKYKLSVGNTTIEDYQPNPLIPGKVGTCYVVQLAFVKSSGHAIAVADESTRFPSGP